MIPAHPSDKFKKKQQYIHDVACSSRQALSDIVFIQQKSSLLVQKLSPISKKNINCYKIDTN